MDSFTVPNKTQKGALSSLCCGRQAVFAECLSAQSSLLSWAMGPTAGSVVSLILTVADTFGLPCQLCMKSIVFLHRRATGQGTHIPELSVGACECDMSRFLSLLSLVKTRAKENRMSECFIIDG